MPQPHLRTRSRKRIKLRLPSGASQVHYKKENPSIRKCAICKQPLAGIPRSTPTEQRKLNRTKRRTWRPYGGQICSNCLRKALKQTVRTV